MQFLERESNKPAGCGVKMWCINLSIKTKHSLLLHSLSYNQGFYSLLLSDKIISLWQWSPNHLVLFRRYSKTSITNLAWYTFGPLHWEIILQHRHKLKEAFVSLIDVRFCSSSHREICSCWWEEADPAVKDRTKLHLNG